MNANEVLCSSLIDELNDVFAKSRTASQLLHPVVSIHKDAGLQTTGERVLKNRLLSALRQCFIDECLMTICQAQLSLFCAQEGFEIVTSHISDNRVCFYLRADCFDIVVEHVK